MSAKLRVTLWISLMAVLLAAMVLVFVLVINGSAITDDPAGSLVKIVLKNADNIEFDRGEFEWDDLDIYRRGVYCSFYDEDGNMVYGAVHGNSDPDDADAKKAHYARVQEFAARFKAEHETIICRELLKNIALKKENTSEPEARTDEYYRVRPCVRFVESAARILEEMLAE